VIRRHNSRDRGAPTLGSCIRESYTAAVVTARRLPPHKNMLFVGGVLLVLFGIGNWVAGAVRTRPYAAYLERNPGPRFPSQGLKADLLEAPDEKRQERDVARAKLEFYQVVQSGGRFMVLLGSICLLGGWVARRSRRYPNLMPSNR
jgi:hypothetical protein